MPFVCQYCHHWQGTKHSEWGMCNCVMVALYPEILTDLQSPFEYKEPQAPFDPHDFYTYYYRNNALLRKIKKTKLSSGVKRLDVTKPSLIFIYNKDGDIIGERVSRVWIPIFFTYKLYSCSYMFV